MQLLIILALLLYGGKAGGVNSILSEVKPVLESIGGDEMREALKSAEEISSVLSAVQGFAGEVNQNKSSISGTGQADAVSNPIAFPLAPISAIADKDITYSLSKYIAQN